MSDETPVINRTDVLPIGAREEAPVGAREEPYLGPKEGEGPQAGTYKIVANLPEDFRVIQGQRRFKAGELIELTAASAAALIGDGIVEPEAIPERRVDSKLPAKAEDRRKKRVE